MPVTIRPIDDHTYLLRLSGKVMRTEFDDVQDPVAGDIDAGVNPRILAIIENFEGWEQSLRGATSISALARQRIEKIAIVGEPRWEPEGLRLRELVSAMRR